MGWNGKQCQLCGRFANHFYGSQEDDGSTTYADERCLTPAERTFYDLPAEVRSPGTTNNESEWKA